MLLLVVTLMGVALGTGFLLARSAQAQTSEAARKEKWEYCAISTAYWNPDNFGRSSDVAFINYFDASGTRQEKLEMTLLGKNSSDFYFNGEREAIARAMAKLGNDGWEMVGRESNKSENSKDFIYFKRLKP